MIGGNSNEALKSIVSRIEELDTEIKNLQSDRTDIYTEAKGNGVDIKALRIIIRERKLPANERADREAILDTYRAALGMLSDLPLGQAALQRAAG